MKLHQNIIWFLFYYALLVCSFATSWLVHKQINFAYPAWYQVLQIQNHIDEYAPQNKFQKQSFQTTSPKQHISLFAQINTAIHQNGIGLESIRYRGENQYSQQLLTQAEIVHLKDVASLINTLSLISIAHLIMCILLVIYIKQCRVNRPKATAILATTTISALTLIGTLLIYGFEQVFYQLHQWVFPKNHQWFFYYQDSLMSTLMKAPDLFAYISMTLTLLAIIIFSSVIFFTSKYLPQS